MAPSVLSRAEKEKVHAIVERAVGFIRPLDPRRQDWLVKRDGSLSVFITFSKQAQLFYDINPQDLKDWSGYRKAFVLFVMGSHKEVLVIPLKTIQQIVTGLQEKGRGDYKLHLCPTLHGYAFRESSEIELKPYFNQYRLLTE